MEEKAKNVQAKAIGITIVALLRMIKMLLPAQKAKEIIDDFMDTFEDKDPILKEACLYVREVMSIPDNIGGDED